MTSPRAGHGHIPVSLDVVLGIVDAPPPLPLPLPVQLWRLAERARSYVEAASSANTRKAHAADWKHFGAWCRRQLLPALPPDPQIVGLYVTACAGGAARADRKPNCLAEIERRLCALGHTHRGQTLD
jgi:hypothetical protein